MIGLCLSGGGFRAALFHLGSLRRLNETGLLSKMTTISSVSGGSILNGLLAKHWPNLKPDAAGVFANFHDLVEAELRQFCSQDIRTYPLIWGRLNPLNWPRLWLKDESATNLLADTYGKKLVPGVAMSHLKNIADAGGPRFVFCASCLQTGVNFVLEPGRIGDYQIGYAWDGNFPVSYAVAASSAFPLAFPPLVVRLGGFAGGKIADGKGKEAIRRKLLLTDGGVYDNLGLEPVWKKSDVVFCSDGGKPFQIRKSLWKAFVPRLMRAQEVIGNQAGAVRKRWLIDSYNEQKLGGAYWGIATEIENYEVGVRGYSGRALERIAGIRTDLDVFTENEQLVLMNHGWALTKAALMRYYPAAPQPEGEIPSRDLLDKPNF